ncbi:MAG: hypothetical protein EZS28_019455 [Streblomastix strix]|uniref:Uncharacterized protein n=1 Tax=Streblomastix strix TaxID=222440 RepID=A0A5J4VQR6_9EUKA|nr:MAG: hypothetical protein EZS28_019455 [Streblomastix strix]
MQASNNIAVQTDPDQGLIRATAKSKIWMFGLLMIIFSILFWIGLIVVLVLKFVPIIGALIVPGVILLVYRVILLSVNDKATVIFDLRSRILTINNVCCYKQLKLNLNTGKIYILDSIFKGDELVQIAEAIIPVVGPQMIAPYMYTDSNTVTASEPALSKEEQEQDYQLVSLCPTQLPENDIQFAKE